jgi:hypothetical protein
MSLTDEEDFRSLPRGRCFLAGQHYAGERFELRQLWRESIVLFSLLLPTGKPIRSRRWSAF